MTLTVDGTSVMLSNPNRILYPESDTSKYDVAMYYLHVAPALIPWAMDRPATRKGWVKGVGTEAWPGKNLFQRRLDTATPEWVSRQTMHHKKRDIAYPLVNDARTLVWLAQLAALEIHVPPWKLSGVGQPKNPDHLVLDVDPGEGAGLAECAAVALLARESHRQLGLRSVPVTSGSKGIHIYAGLDGRRTSAEISTLAHRVALSMERDHPNQVVSRMGKGERRGKVFFDWSQNWQSKSAIVPYSLRGRAAHHGGGTEGMG